MSRTSITDDRNANGDVRHVWLRGGTAADRQARLAELALPPALASVSAHRNRRGPYTGAGGLVRQLAPSLLRDRPDLVARHDIEIRVVAPELDACVPNSRQTLTSTAAAAERTRFYPRAHTLRIAHGLTELLATYQQGLGGTNTVVIDDADHADPSDLELLAVLLRRLDPQRLRLVVGTSRQVPESLGSSLLRYADELTVTQQPGRSQSHYEEAAREYVFADCSSDDEWLRGAYEALSETARVALHDRRAAELEACGDLTVRLGAVPYHRERGSDRAGAGVDALLFALEHCVLLGFYPAVLDLAARCRTLLNWSTDPDRSWLVTAKECTALTALGLPDQAAAEYDRACANTTSPGVHLQAAYGRAMLFTRFYDQPRLDHQQAKAHINTAIAISQLLPQAEQRAFNTTFNENGLALIEMHLGDLETSLRLVRAGLDRLQRELQPDQHALQRSVLLYNQAQLLAALRRPQEAVHAYDELIAADPHHSEYYFERAALHRLLESTTAALSDYADAIRLSPPYPEPHVNRADLALELGDLDLARADLNYVLELDPKYVDAYLNRASIRLELGDSEGALHDTEIGLALEPDSALLHCVRGQAAADTGRTAEAHSELRAAVDLDPALAGGWASLGALHYAQGDLDAAIQSFDRAVGLGDDHAIVNNRGIAHQAAGHWAAAIADYTQVLEVLHDSELNDRAELLYRRATCHVAAPDVDAALRDLQACRLLTTSWRSQADALLPELLDTAPGAPAWHS